MIFCQSTRGWSLKDAKLELKILESFDTKWKPWNILLAQALHELLQRIDNDDDSLGLKATLEKSDGQALEQLWNSIEASASILLLSLPTDQKTVRDILLGNVS